MMSPNTSISQHRQFGWGPLAVAMMTGATLVVVVLWRMNVQKLEHQVVEKRQALKRLMLSGGIPPNQEVMEYLTAREHALQTQYQDLLGRIAPPLAAEAGAGADPQLSFQQRVHDVQRTLERLAAARTMPVPEQLGFPKELPPTETVPRLLVQLALIQEASGLIFQQGVEGFASVKLEDPEPVEAPEGDASFLTRVPVRVRVSGSLPQVMKLLGALERSKPLIDIRALRLLSSATAERLDTELVLARYLIIHAQ